MYNNERIILTAIFIFPALPEFPSALEDQNFPLGEIPSPCWEPDVPDFARQKYLVTVFHISTILVLQFDDRERLLIY